MIADEIVKAKERPPTFIYLIKIRPKVKFNTTIARLDNKIIPTLLIAFACLNAMALKTQKGSWSILYLITLAIPKTDALSIAI